MLPLLDIRNKLAFPAGRAPGFDPSHIASNNVVSSVVASGGIFRSLLNPLNTTPGSGYSRSIRSTIGDNVYCDTGAPLLTGSKSGGTPTALTFVVILEFTSVSGTQEVVNLGSSPSEVFRLQGGYMRFFAATGAYYFNAITPAVNVPYFLALTTDGSVGHVLMLNLKNGVLKTQKYTGATTFGAFDGYANFGAVLGSIRPSLAYISAGQISGSYLGESGLIQWAADPWSFWYPRRASNIIGTSAAPSGFKPAWARGTNRIVGGGLAA